MAGLVGVGVVGKGERPGGPANRLGGGGLLHCPPGRPSSMLVLQAVVLTWRRDDDSQAA